MKTFLKWAGNKSSIVNLIQPHLAGKTLIEPFAGSCAVSLNTDFNKYVCNDINGDLIQMYKLIQNDVESFITESKNYFIGGNVDSRFYELRDLYNTTDDLNTKAYLFLYLNRHCFNGLCRYNKSKKFNVPFGKYTAPYYPEDEIREFAKKVKSFTFTNQDYTNLFDLADKNTVIYCDPPYSPLTDTADFANYSGDGFSNNDHIELARLAETTKCLVIISNHDTPHTRALYQNADEIISFEVKRTISSKVTERKKAPELLAIYK